VLSGFTRPFHSTNLWCSDSRQPLPQWLQLEWAELKPVQTVELTFPGHLLREWNAYGPLYRDAQCPRDYRIEMWVDAEWKTVHQVTNNYQRHCRHRLTTVILTTKLRVVITATNGDPSAAIYEVRCYAE
jgi:hypothetical protein